MTETLTAAEDALVGPVAQLVRRTLSVRGPGVHDPVPSTAGGAP